MYLVDMYKEYLTWNNQRGLRANENWTNQTNKHSEYGQIVFHKNLIKNV